MRIFINIAIILILPLLFIGTRFVEKAEHPPTVSNLMQHKINSTSEYCNSRFDYCLVYSSTLLPVRSASSNDDGTKLFTEDRKGEVTVVGAHNIFNWTPEELFQFRLENTFPNKSEQIVVLSQTFGEDYYKVHFIDTGKNILQEAFFKDGIYVLFSIEVGETQSELLNKLKENTALEFREVG